jgi:hypothetical protein
MELLASFTPSGMTLPPSDRGPSLSSPSALDALPLRFVNTASAMLEVAESEFCGLRFERRKIDGRGPSALCILEIAAWPRMRF